MIENTIKKMLRKWLKKKVFAIECNSAQYSKLEADLNAARFNWVYNAPLKEWRDRLWVVRNTLTKREKALDAVLRDYLYS